MQAADFKKISLEAQTVMDLRGIQHDDTDVIFPDDLMIGSDQGGHNQPSYYTYKTCGETFVYPLDREVLIVE
jgi:NAD(P)H-nitrite reductase large subunit